MVLLSSPFWVAWLAVILNQQGGLSGAEGSAEGEVCVCLFEALSFFVHICLVVLRIHIKDIVLRKHSVNSVVADEVVPVYSTANISPADDNFTRITGLTL